MTLAHALLLALFALTILKALTLKLCSIKLDQRTAPVFIGVWVLAGLAATWPFFHPLLSAGLHALAEKPYLLVLCILKGGLLYLTFVIGQELMRDSLSSSNYVMPMAVGLIAIVNSTLGEHLHLSQWVSALGLCALTAGFFFKGHLSDLSREGKLAYVKLVLLSVALAGIDQTVISHINWYALLLVSNISMLSLSLILNRTRRWILRDALFHRSAVFAGVFFTVTELVKFYQQVTINPVTVALTVQSAAAAAVLVLSALLWKERTVKEQLFWGVLAFIVTLPLFL